MELLKLATEWAKAEVFSTRFFIFFAILFLITSIGFWQLGKELLENYELSKESKEIYKLALREFPNSFLLNFSFGTILYGDKNNGFTKFYKICIDLYSENPENKKFENDY